MKTLVKLLGTIFTLLVIVVAIEIIASESGEVVVVTITDEHGTPSETRLWVVDHDGDAWLRAGSASSGWYQRLQRHPQVALERQGRTFDAKITAVPELRNTINALMRDKYGWADTYISFLFSRDNALPLRVAPLPN